MTCLTTQPRPTLLDCRCTTSPIQPQTSLRDRSIPSIPHLGEKVRSCPHTTRTTNPSRSVSSSTFDSVLPTELYPPAKLLSPVLITGHGGLGGVGSPESARLNFSNVRTREEEVCYLPQSHSPPHQPNPPSPPFHASLLLTS
jgi:hypothetical protein